MRECDSLLGPVTLGGTRFGYAAVYPQNSLSVECGNRPVRNDNAGDALTFDLAVNSDDVLP